MTATTGISLPGDEAGSEVEKEQTRPSDSGGVSVGKEGGREGGRAAGSEPSLPPDPPLFEVSHRIPGGEIVRMHGRASRVPGTSYFLPFHPPSLPRPFLSPTLPPSRRCFFAGARPMPSGRLAGGLQWG